jgi:acyl-CoA thioesterase
LGWQHYLGIIMRFSEVMQTVVRQGEQWTAEFGEDWLQGRSAFGGVQVALVVRALRDLVPATTPLRTVQVTFLAPVPAGRVEIQARVLREGKNTVQLEGRIVDGEQTLCLVIAVFGVARESTVRVLPQQPPVDAGADVPVFPFIPGLTPAFTQHFSARWLRGDLPYSGGRKTTSTIELSLKDDGPVDETTIIAFADFIPPLALSMLSKPTPGSSLTWMLELLSDRRDLPCEGWRVDAQLDAAIDGYTSQGIVLWGPSGEVMALGRQSMVVFG